jgi:hypothetical protein
MKTSNLLIRGAIAVLCALILVVFTDIEVSMVRWFSCGPFSTASEQQSEVCKRKL